jgi:small subunit ribosomal protein S1
MIHISDLSWLKRYNHPGEFTKVGEKIDVIIMGIDKDNRKLQLGHKQLEEDPGIHSKALSVLVQYTRVPS